MILRLVLVKIIIIALELRAIAAETQGKHNKNYFDTQKF